MAFKAVFLEITRPDEAVEPKVDVRSLARWEVRVLRGKPFDDKGERETLLL